MKSVRLLFLLVFQAFCSPVDILSLNSLLYTSANATISVNLIAPELPKTLAFESLEAFLFKIDLEGKEQDKVNIFIAKGSTSSDTKNNDTAKPVERIKQISTLKVHNGIDTYMVIWSPLIDDVPEEGGNDFFVLITKTSWFGWYEEVIYESEYFTIEPYYGKKSLVLQIA